MLLTLLSALLVSSPTAAATAPFRLTSTSIAEGEMLAPTQVYRGFGCQGGDRSPQLAWSGVPDGTKSFAVTVYDPDAPTGSGWWHWSIIDLPAAMRSLPAGASGTADRLGGATELRNDYGTPGFGGACPPPGEVHRYVVTIHALGVDHLDLPRDAGNALAGFMIRSNTIAIARITAIYHR